MKYLFSIFLIVTFFVVSQQAANAQIKSPAKVGNKTYMSKDQFLKQFPVSMTTTRNQKAGNKKASCGTDTVLYTLAKSSGFRYTILDGDKVLALAQAFGGPGDAKNFKLYGFRFYAAQVDDTLKNTKIKLALHDVQSGIVPKVAAFDSATFTVHGSSSFTGYEGYFNKPVTITKDYFISMEMMDTLNVAFIVNDYINGDGNGKYFSAFKLSNGWRNGQGITIGGNTFDGDIIVYPIVSYDLDVQINDTCVTPDEDAAFKLDTIPVLVASRFYNQKAYNVAFGSFDSAFFWSSGNQTDYGIPGTFNFGLADSNYTVNVDVEVGWANKCIISDKLTGKMFYAKTEVVNPNCSTSVGSVTVKPQNGKAPYKYLYHWIGKNYVTNNKETAPAGNLEFDVMDAKGCTLKNQPVTVKNGGLSITITGDTYLCDEDLTSIDINVSGSSNFEINFNNQGYSSNTKYDNLGKGTYAFKVKDGSGCVKDTSVKIDKTPYSVSLSASKTTVTTVEDITFTGSAPNSSNCTYSFGDGSSNINSCSSTKHAFTKVGTYWVHFTGKGFPDGCDLTDSIEITVQNKVGIYDLSKNYAFNIFPNPVHKEINVKKDKGTSNYSIEILSTDGKISLSKERLSEDTEKIDISELRPGLYIIRLSSENSTEYHKFLKK